MAKSTKNRSAGQGTSIGIVGPSNGRHACGAARLKEEKQTLRGRGGKERKRTQRRRARLTAIPAEVEAENKTRFSSPSLSLSLYPSLFAGRQKVESGCVCMSDTDEEDFGGSNLQPVPYSTATSSLSHLHLTLTFLPLPIGFRAGHRTSICIPAPITGSTIFTRVQVK